MISLSRYRWHKCILCGYYYKTTIRKKYEDDKNKRYISVNCIICSFNDKKDYYYRQLLLDFNHLIRKDDKWVPSYDEDRYSERIERTIYWMYKSLGPIVAEDVFYRAMDTYWYTKRFKKARSPRF